MAINKHTRQIIYQKFNGKCAYSGTVLLDDWQVDHIVPQRLFKCGMPGNQDCIDNLMPVQKIINHYKRALSMHDFKSWYLAGLHLRLAKLPKNPRTKKSVKRKKYLQEVARLFNITPDRPFSGKLYFESL